MKKVLVVLMSLIIACFGISAFAVEYNDVEVKASIEFEGITDADLGGDSAIIGDFDPHGDWGLAEGTANIVESVNGNGLQFTPDYDNANGFNSCVMRASMPCIAAESEAWGAAWGLRFYICNNTYYDAYVTPMAFFYNEDASAKTVLGVGNGAYTVDIENEYYEVELVTYVDNCNSTVLIPSGFEGYLVLPFAVMGGSADDYDCGWQIMPGWSDADFTADTIDFGAIGDFSIDIRVSQFASDDVDGIVLDSVEFIGNKGDEVEKPEAGVLPTPQASEPAGDIGNTSAPDTNVTPDAEVPSAPAEPANGFPVWIIIVAAVVVVAVVVVVIIVAGKKKKA